MEIDVTTRTPSLWLAATVMLAWSISSALMAADPLTCDDNLPLRQQHLSAEPLLSNLPAVPALGISGGDGELVQWIIQQAGPEGYREIAITEDGLMADGLAARLLDVDMNAGIASFEACSDQGFLVIAVYTDEAALTGLLVEALSSQHAVNYANVTLFGNDRIGSGFNSGGAEGTLDIISRQLTLPAEDIGRSLAELVLTENVSSVLEVAESQAPVFAFESDSCVVQDQFIVHSRWPNICIGFANPAVTAIDVVIDGRLGQRMTSDRSFVSVADEVYVVTIGEGEQARRVPMASIVLDRE